MINTHSREDELNVQIIGLQGIIEKLKQQIENDKKEFLNEFSQFHNLLKRIRESRSSGKIRGIIPEVACILEEEIHSYGKEGYKRKKWEQEG